LADIPNPEEAFKTWSLLYCEDLIRADPRNIWAHFRKAQLYMEEKKYNELEDALLIVQRIDPQF
jgi:hypothetical protein